MDAKIINYSEKCIVAMRVIWLTVSRKFYAFHLQINSKYFFLVTDFLFNFVVIKVRSRGERLKF